jgi:Cu2+-containing amine oxidase
MSDEQDKELELKKEDEQEDKIEEPKVDVKALDVEALRKALREEIAESIRTEEKAKLYPSMEKYKTDAKTASDAKDAAEAKLKEYETKNLSAEEQVAQRYKELQESNEMLTERFNKVVEEANGRINSLQVELAKKEILAAYKDEIITGMVTGDTIEELQQSAENAHREYKAIEEKAQAKIAAVGKAPIGSGLAQPNSDKLNVSPTLADIKKVTNLKEWDKVKTKLLEDALKQ